MNLYPDMSVNTRSGGHDLIFNGLKVDVKTTKYKSGRLLAAKGKTIADSDIYVLMIGSRPSYTIAGWCKSEELIKNSNLVDLGYGFTYSILKERLTPVEALSKNL